MPGKKLTGSQKQRIINYRKERKTVDEISKITNNSISTIYYLCKDIPIKFNELPCKECSIKFTPKHKHDQFCSSKCGSNYRRKKYYWQKPEIEKEKAKKYYSENRAEILSKLRKGSLPEHRKEKKCERCNKPFRPLSKFHPNERFCNGCKLSHKRERNREKRVKIYSDSWDSVKKCVYCNKIIVFDRTKPKNTELIRKYCSEKCRERHLAKDFREKHPDKVGAIKRKSYYKHHEKRLMEAKKHKYQRRALGEKTLSSFDELKIRIRDNYKCAYCHRDKIKLTNDHLIPVKSKENLNNSLLNSNLNLVTCCFECNRKKQNKTVEDFLKTKYCSEKNINRENANQIVWKLLRQQTEQKTLKNKPN